MNEILRTEWKSKIFLTNKNKNNDNWEFIDISKVDIPVVTIRHRNTHKKGFELPLDLLDD
jgi:hypothetical protein